MSKSLLKVVKAAVAILKVKVLHSISIYSKSYLLTLHSFQVSKSTQCVKSSLSLSLSLSHTVKLLTLYVDLSAVL